RLEPDLVQGNLEPAILPQRRLRPTNVAEVPVLYASGNALANGSGRHQAWESEETEKAFNDVSSGDPELRRIPFTELEQLDNFCRFRLVEHFLVKLSNEFHDPLVDHRLFLVV